MAEFIVEQDMMAEDVDFIKLYVVRGAIGGTR
jgi:hypothetical protein